MDPRSLLWRSLSVAPLLLYFCTASASNAQEQKTQPSVTTSAGGGLAFAPGTRGSLELHVTNPQEHEVDLLSLTYLDNDPTLQFGRRMWVPPQSRRRTWQPIRLPPPAELAAASVDYKTLVLQHGPDGESVLRDSMGRMVREGALPLGLRTKSTAIIDTGDPGADEFAKQVDQLVGAVRLQDRSLRTSSLYLSPLPLTTEESLEAVDCLVIADSRIRSEPAVLDAVRRWLYGGGRLWVLLDQVDAEVLEGLLGDEFACQVVDRTSLTHVQFEAGPAGVKVEAEPADFEQPVDFVRLVAAGMDVMYTVDGWPAAMLKPCGDGELLITTLGPAGWLRQNAVSSVLPGRAGPPPATAAQPNPARVATALKNVAADFFGEARAPLVPPGSLEPIVQEYVGYQIPPSWLVVGLLSVFNLLVIGAGLVLSRTGRLDRAGILIPLAAVVVAAALIAVGIAHRQGIPPTVAQLQFVQVISGTDDERITGVAGLYLEGKPRIEGGRGGWTELALSERATETRRLVWTDHDRWEWENLQLPSGVQTAAYRASSLAAPRVEARASFGPDGLTGRLQLGTDRPEDVMVVTQYGRIAVAMGAEGEFVARADQVMSHGQYISAALLSDEQNRRQRVLSTILANEDRPDFPRSPQLFYWTGNVDSGIEFGADVRRIGSALVAVPVRLERPAAGAEVTIPAPLVAYRAVDGPDGTAPTGLYDYRKHQWLERSRPSSAWLKFQVPPLLLPFEPIAGQMTIEVSGPVRQLEIAAFEEGQVVPLETWSDPVGTLTARLTQAQYLRLADDGTILLRVAGGGPAGGNAIESSSGQTGRASYWRIESLRFDVRGRVLSNPIDSPPPAP